MIKKLMICPYFGTLPPWFDSYLANIEMLKPLGYDWHITTNLKLFKERVGDILGIKCPIVPGTGKPWDYRPAFGVLFAEELKRYDYWGHTDFDCVYGRVDRFVTDEFLGLATPPVESRRDPAVDPRWGEGLHEPFPKEVTLVGWERKALFAAADILHGKKATMFEDGQYYVSFEDVAGALLDYSGERPDSPETPAVGPRKNPWPIDDDFPALPDRTTLVYSNRLQGCFITVRDMARNAGREVACWIDGAAAMRMNFSRLFSPDLVDTLTTNAINDFLKSIGDRPESQEIQPEAVSPTQKPLDIHSNHHNYMCGPWSLYRNRDVVNGLFQLVANWQEFLVDPKPNAWIEGVFTNVVDWAREQGTIRGSYTHLQSFNPGDTSNVGNFNGSLSLYDRKRGETQNEEIMMCHFRHTKEYPKGVRYV